MGSQKHIADPQTGKSIALAKKGKRIEPFKAPAGVDKTQADQDYQRGEVERSIKYCKEVLGLGLRA